MVKSEKIMMNVKNMKEGVIKRVTIVVIIALTLSLFAIFSTTALPGGPSIRYVANYSKDATTPTERTVDQKGTITDFVFNMSQQNLRWKAYVGNITGKLVLADANNNSIYDWDMSSFTGEVYTSRDSSITWPNINCSNLTTIESEDTTLNHDAGRLDSINMTFSEGSTIHRSFVVGNAPILNSSCRAIALNNGTRQTGSESAPFQEILLQDASAKLVYVTLIESAKTGFNGQQYDFQMIVSEDDSAGSPTSYYFYVELI